MQTSGGRMSNDLLFPILPRNTKVPIETDDRVKTVSRREADWDYRKISWKLER